MPRSLDIQGRKQDIAEATMTLLAQGGSRALTVKALAAQLGGSTTLITHIYPRKADLYEGVLAWLESDLESSLSAAADTRDPRANLRALIEWCLPLDARSLEMERTRLGLLTRADDDERIREFLENLEKRMRTLIRERLAPVVPDDRLDILTAYVRSITNGAVLSAAEHPEKWTRSRQLAATTMLMTVIDGATPSPPTDE